MCSFSFDLFINFCCHMHFKLDVSVRKFECGTIDQLQTLYILFIYFAVFFLFDILRTSVALAFSIGVNFFFSFCCWFLHLLFVMKLKTNNLTFQCVLRFCGYECEYHFLYVRLYMHKHKYTCTIANTFMVLPFCGSMSTEYEFHRNNVDSYKFTIHPPQHKSDIWGGSGKEMQSVFIKHFCFFFLLSPKLSNRNSVQIHVYFSFACAS